MFFVMDVHTLNLSNQKDLQDSHFDVISACPNFCSLKEIVLTDTSVTSDRIHKIICNRNLPKIFNLTKLLQYSDHYNG